MDSRTDDIGSSTVLHARQLMLSTLTGSLAGLFALAADELAASSTLGQWISVTPRMAFVYLAVGSGAGLLLEGGGRLLGRPAFDLRRIFCAAVAWIYTLTIFDRLYNLAVTRMPWPLALFVAAVVSVAGFGLWIAALRRLGGIGLADATSAALLLGSCSVALGYAINHNRSLGLLEPAALAADAWVAGGTLAVALGLRLVAARRGVLKTEPALVLTTLAFTVAAVLLAISANVPSPPRDVENATARPDLILVVIDTLRYDTFESVIRETPEGRAFHAALGAAAWFDQAVAAAPWTAPSVGSIMTGLYPLEHGFGSSWKSGASSYRRLSDAAVPLAERLRDRGYRTEAIVTNSVLHPIWGLERGFERYEMLSHPAEILPLPNLLVRAGLLERIIYQPAAAVTRRLRRRLAASEARDRPLFIWLHLTDPHYPVHAHPGLPPEARPPPDDEWERLYRQETRYTLRELTRMVKLFQESGHWDDAAFLLVSDHGEMFESDGHVVEAPGRDPVRVGHGHSLYGVVLRVPLVIRPPGGLPSERRLDVLVSHTDLYDTVLDLLGIDGPRSGGDRVSLAPWLAPEWAGQEPPRRHHALIMVNLPSLGPAQRGFRSAGLKYVQFPNGELSDELYDLRVDAAEHDNLAARRPLRLEEARRALEASWSRLDETEAGDGFPAIDDDTRRRLEALGYVD